MALDILHKFPIAVGAAAVYPYDLDILKQCERFDKFDKQPYNLARIVRSGQHQRIWVPRNMAPRLIKDLRQPGLDATYKSTFEPRNSEQARVVKESVQLIAQSKSFIIQAPPGFGKTMCSADIIAQAGKKTIVVVTKQDIVDQWVEALGKTLGLVPGKGIGFIQGDKVDVVGRKVVIAMVQSLSREHRYPEHTFKDFGLAIWDECHRIGADFFSQSCMRIPAMVRVGLSATPERKDGRTEVLHAHIGPVMVSTEKRTMKPRIICRESPWECPMTRKVGKDGKLILDSAGVPALGPLPHTAMRCSHIIKLLVHHHARNKVFARFIKQCYDSGRTILAQSDSKEHLEIMHPLITAAGIPAAHIDYYVGGLKKSEREEAKKARVMLSTYKMTSEATDIPWVDTLVMLTPKSDVVQIIGRVTREMEGKVEPVVFDLVDSSSPVFAGFAKSRKKQYSDMGGKIQYVSHKN